MSDEVMMYADVTNVKREKKKIQSIWKNYFKTNR